MMSWIRGAFMVLAINWVHVPTPRDIATLAEIRDEWLRRQSVDEQIRHGTAPKLILESMKEGENELNNGEYELFMCAYCLEAVAYEASIIELGEWRFAGHVDMVDRILNVLRGNDPELEPKLPIHINHQPCWWWAEAIVQSTGVCRGHIHTARQERRY